MNYVRAEENVYRAQGRQIRSYGGRRKASFEIGNFVMVTDYRGKMESWVKARIVQELVAGVTYLVELSPNIIWKRHCNQMRECDEDVRILHSRTNDTNPERLLSDNSEPSTFRRSKRLQQQ